MGPGVVFLGPSLDLATARAAVDAVFLPPAVQGSVVSAVQEFNPAAIVIIDGSFQDYRSLCRPLQSGETRWAELGSPSPAKLPIADSGVRAYMHLNSCFRVQT